MKCLGLTLNSYDYLYKSVKDRKKKESSIPVEDIMNSIKQIMEYPCIGGVKGSLTLLRNKKALIGATFYTQIKNMTRELAEKEIVKRKEQSELHKNQLTREKATQAFKQITVNKPNKVWAIDFVYIKFLGITFYLCLVYDWGTQTYLAVEASENIDHVLAIKAVKAAVRFAGTKPEKFMVSDNGWQFIHNHYKEILKQLRIIDIKIPKRKPWYNGSLESGNKDLRKLLYTIAVYHACNYTEITKKGVSRHEIFTFLQDCCLETQRVINEEIVKCKFQTTPQVAFENNIAEELKEMAEYKVKKMDERKERIKQLKNKENNKTHSFEDKIMIAWKRIVKSVSFEKLYAFNELIHGRYQVISS